MVLRQPRDTGIAVIGKGSQDKNLTQKSHPGNPGVIYLNAYYHFIHIKSMNKLE